MRRAIAVALVALIVGSSGAVGADGRDAGKPAAPKDADKPETPKKDKCMTVHSEARYGGYGYDHLVEIENTCDRTLQCTVKTDVNPEPSSVTVPAKEKRLVITFRGSPSREFTPDVRCTSEGDSQPKR